MEKSVYLFYGEDTYMIKNKTKKIIEKSQVDEFNVSAYDMEEISIKDAINDALTIPFMADKKVIVISNAYFLSNNKIKNDINHNVDELVNYVNNPLESSILIIQAPYEKIDQRKAVFKALKNKANLEKCDCLKKEDLSSWVRVQIAKKGLEIDTNALEEFLKRTKNNTQVAVLELKKLLLYSEDFKKIDLDLIKRIITKNVEDNVYELTNAIVSGNKAKSLGIYNDLLSNNEDPIYLLGIIVNKFREILHVKLLLKQGYTKYDIMKYFNVNSGRAYYMVKNANDVNMDIVKKYIDALDTLDSKIKRGYIDKKIGLELFLLKM